MFAISMGYAMLQAQVCRTHYSTWDFDQRVRALFASMLLEPASSGSASTLCLFVRLSIPSQKVAF